MDRSKERQLVDSWLKAVGQEVGQEFQLDDNGICVIDYKDSLTIIVEVPDNGRGYYIYSPLTTIDVSQNDLTIPLRALSLNLFQVETGGGTLSYDESTSEIVFSFLDQIEGRDTASFKSVINNFVTLSLKLKKDLSSPSEPKKALGSEKEKPARQPFSMQGGLQV